LAIAVAAGTPSPNFPAQEKACPRLAQSLAAGAARPNNRNSSPSAANSTRSTRREAAAGQQLHRRVHGLILAQRLPGTVFWDARSTFRCKSFYRTFGFLGLRSEHDAIVCLHCVTRAVHDPRILETEPVAPNPSSCPDETRFFSATIQALLFPDIRRRQLLIASSGAMVGRAAVSRNAARAGVVAFNTRLGGVPLERRGAAQAATCKRISADRSGLHRAAAALRDDSWQAGSLETRDFFAMNSGRESTRKTACHGKKIYLRRNARSCKQGGMICMLSGERATRSEISFASNLRCKVYEPVVSGTIQRCWASPNSASAPARVCKEKFKHFLPSFLRDFPFSCVRLGDLRHFSAPSQR